MAKNSYEAVKISIYYRVCETLLSQGKNLKNEISRPEYRFEQSAHTIKPSSFFDFLREIGMDVEEFSQSDYKTAFQTTEEDFFILTELLLYNEKMATPENNSIFDHTNASLREIEEDLVEHLINSIIQFMYRREQTVPRDKRERL